MTDLLQTAARAKAWLTRDALPLWASAGVDERGAFHETLDFAGRPDLAAVRRMRVQARQLYVFSEAASRGWLHGAGDIADRGFQVLAQTCWAPDGEPGFVQTLAADLTPLNRTRDAYDHAFGLFALAWRAHASASADARGLADRAFAFMDARMADRTHGGVVESLPPVLPRRSNPHMHLLEACLAWLSFTGERVFAERARAILALFRDRFFDAETGTYGEYFTGDWRPVAGEAGQAVEPGHHCEWVWLLDWASRLGLAEGEPFMAPLYDWVLAHGLDASGLAVDECDRTGRQRRRSRRAWVQTELIKAHVAMARRGRPGAAEAAAGACGRFLDSYLATPVKGLWMDQFDEAGAGMAAQVPASTLYHVVAAFRELILFAEAQPGLSSSRR